MVAKCVLCYRTDTGRGKGYKLLRNKEITAGAVPPNDGVIRFASNMRSCSFCIDSACLEVLPLVLKDDSEGFLSKSTHSFILNIHNKIYSFPNDKRVINGLPNRIREILKKYDQAQHKTDA
jgi:hypothetical protein